MRMLISGFCPVKELGTRANQKISGYSQTCGRLKQFEYAACGRENFRIRKKLFIRPLVCEPQMYTVLLILKYYRFVLRCRHLM